ANLLEDTEYIGVADMTVLVSAVSALDPATCPEVGRLIQQEGLRLREFGPRERLWLLAISATHADESDIRDQLLAGGEPVLLPDWAHPLGARYQKIVGHTRAVRAL